MGRPTGRNSEFQQLPLMMTAREIRRDYRALDGDRMPYPPWDGGERSENDDELFDRKNEEAEDDGLADEIRRDNYHIRNPISLQFKDYRKPREIEHPDEEPDDRPEVLGGHHRLAVMDAEAPDRLIPVHHEPNDTWAQRTLGDRY